jgi:hypothetical protein
LVAEVLVAARTPPAAPARRKEGRHYVVADLQVPHPGTDLLHYAGTLVATDDRQRHGKVAGADVMIRVAEPGGLEGHQDLTVLRAVEVYFLDTPFLIDCP